MRGRTSSLTLNYRNTREILHFAFDFAKEYLQEKDADEDSVPLIKPQMGGNSGQAPVFRLLSNPAQELSFIRTCLQKWHDDGVACSDMAVIYCHHIFGEALSRELHQHSIPNVWMGDAKNRRQYDPLDNKVLLVTRQSSKGLEFPRVIVAGLGGLKDDEEAMPEEARLLYVAMARAQQYLLLTSSVNNHYAQRLVPGLISG